MSVDKEKLKDLAGQSVLESTWYAAGSHGLKAVSHLHDREFIAAASPATVLALIAENEALRKQVADYERKLDALLAHCDDGECQICAQIICPHGGAMHFHHDGCPSCAEHDAAMAKEAK